MDEIDHVTLLKRELIRLPSESNFEFSDDTRIRLRRIIMTALAKGKEFLPFYFPRLFHPDGTEISPEPASETLYRLQWRYQTYHTQIPHVRDPTYNHLMHMVNHHQRPCGRIFSRGEAIYRCLTCSHDETVALCQHCFNLDDHEGHKIHIYTTQLERGGVCDCGDPEAWEFNRPCRLYDDPVPTQLPLPLPDPVLDQFTRVLRVILNFCIDVLAYLDQHLDSDSENEAEIKLHSKQLTLDQDCYGYWSSSEIVDQNLDKYCLILYNDQTHLYRDAILRIRLALRKQKQFAIMVADRVEAYGRAKVAELTDIAVLQQRRGVLSATGLSTGIRLLRDVFREDMVDEIIFWLDEFQFLEVFKVSTPMQELFCQVFCERWEPGLLALPGPRADESVYSTGKLDYDLRIPKLPAPPIANHSHWENTAKLWSLSEEDCSRCNYNVTTDDYNPRTNHRGLRFQYFVYFDVRLWKQARNNLARVINALLITNLKYRPMLGCQYLDIHLVVADQFVKLDREPELNVMLMLSTQLFSCSTNIRTIFNNGGFGRLLAVVYGFLTTESVAAANAVTQTNDVSIKLFKSQKLGKLFFDVNFMLGKGLLGDVILKLDPVEAMLDMLVLIQGKPVLKRENDSHVEYESSDYNALFTSLHLFKGLDLMIRCGKEISDPVERYNRFNEAILLTLKRLYRLECGEYPNFNADIVDIKPYALLKLEPFTGAMVTEVSLSQDKAALLHPVHSFLGGLLNAAEFATTNDVLAIFEEAVKVVGYAHGDPLAVIFDYPIRTLALLAQIKLGFWVRNGFTVRNQLQLYKLLSLRDYGLLRDLFLIQAFVNLANPNLVVYLILDRFQILSTITDNGESVYDRKTLPYIFEECAALFLYILTENDRGIDYRIRQEIIHLLCFGPMPYSKLISLIPDNIVAEKQFNNKLETLAHYLPPLGALDVGIFTLKPEFYAEVNPFYFSYSANTRDDAVKILKERRAKEMRVPAHQVVLEPTIMEPPKGFESRERFIELTYFTQFVVHALRHSICTESSDGLMMTVLHLLHACALQDNTLVSKLRLTMVPLYEILKDDTFIRYHPKIRTIFEIWKHLDQFTETVVDFNFDTAVLFEFHKEDSPEIDVDHKKKIAKLRQEKLMAKFKQQQSDFLRNMDGADMDVEDLTSDESDSDLGWRFPEPHCILCQNTNEDAGPFGVITYISRSCEFRKVPFDDPFWFMSAYSDSANLDDPEPLNVPTSYLEAGKSAPSQTLESKTSNWHDYQARIRENNVFGPGFNDPNCIENNLVLLSCGHGMHYNCYMNYLATNRNRQNQITRNYPENPDRKEFLCPLCKALNNSFYPILWTSNKFSMRELCDYSGQSDNIGDLYPLILRTQPDWFYQFAEQLKEAVDVKALLTTHAKETINLQSQNKQMLPQQVQFWHLILHMFHLFAFTCFPEVVKLDLLLLLVNTIKSTEIALRGVAGNDTVADQISFINMINLRVLYQFRISGLFMKLQLPLESQLRLDVTMTMFSSYLKISNDGLVELIFSGDFFKILVDCVPLPQLGLGAHFIMERCLWGATLQAVVSLAYNLGVHEFYVPTNEFSVLDVPQIEEIPYFVLDYCKKIFCAFIDTDQFSIINDPLFSRVIYSLIVKQVTPFLRRIAIFASVQCGLADVNKSYLNRGEADRITSYLGLPTIAETMRLAVEDSDSWQGVVMTKVLQRGVSKSQNELIRLEYPGIIRLINLPSRLDSFFTRYFYSDRYDYPFRRYDSPAVCLTCAEVLDVQQKTPGYKEGQCTTHVVRECANSNGMFWLPRERVFLLLHNNGGTFYTAPYIDDQGEVFADPAKRLKTFYLMPPKYQDFIKNIWLQHNVPNIIVRSLDAVSDAGGWDTL
ncbi:hypothetical protein JNB11_02210 [Kocuria palustris]|nr:hypothetical protein [Kocuria palustris]